MNTSKNVPTIPPRNEKAAALSRSKPVKLVKNGVGFILKGEKMPKHIQIAYGRYIFKLMHAEEKHRVAIWPRDLPLNLSDLASCYKFSHALTAYRAECQRSGMEPIQ